MYGIPKLDSAQIYCQTVLHVNKLSNSSKTIVNHIQNNCQTATHKILCATCPKKLSIFTQNNCQNRKQNRYAQTTRIHRCQNGRVLVTIHARDRYNKIVIPVQKITMVHPISPTASYYYI